MTDQTNTPTPRTDAEKWLPESCWDYQVPAQFARQLERELAAVTAERDALREDDNQLRRKYKPAEPNQRDGLALTTK